MTAVSPAKTPHTYPLHLVAIANIAIKPQVRTHFKKAELDELAESIRANGVLQPVLLRPAKSAGRFELIAGERRVRAAKLAGLTHVPAIAGDADDHAKLRMQLAENLDREDLDEREIAKAVKALFDIEQDLGKVATIVRRSKAWVSKHLAPEMRWDYRTQRLFEAGASEDLELLGAFDQLAKLTEFDGSGMPVLTYGDVDAIGKKIAKGEITRDEIRAQVAAAKEQKRERTSQAKTRAAKQKARPPRFNAERSLKELFEGARYDMHGVEEVKLADFDENQRAAMTERLRKAWDEGAQASPITKSNIAEAFTTHDVYRGILRHFLERRYEPEHERAAWIAGYFGQPLELETLQADVAAVVEFEDAAEQDDDPE